ARCHHSCLSSSASANDPLTRRIRAAQQKAEDTGCPARAGHDSVGGKGQPMIKIWGRNTSVNVQKVMWALGEVGVPHERIDVGGSSGKNTEPAYLAMNPNGLVPTLEEDGFLLWESNSIVRYLAAKY